jgi:hypothetical protein
VPAASASANRSTKQNPVMVDAAKFCSCVHRPTKGYLQTPSLAAPKNAVETIN